MTLMSELNIKVTKYPLIMLNNIQIQQGAITNCITNQRAVPKEVLINIAGFLQRSFFHCSGTTMFPEQFMTTVFPLILWLHFSLQCRIVPVSPHRLFNLCDTSWEAVKTWQGFYPFTRMEARDRFFLRLRKPEWENQQQHERSWDSSRGSVKAARILNAASNI